MDHQTILPHAVARSKFGDGRRGLSIVKYNPKWAQQFAAIKGDLEADLGDAKVTYLAIEHIGSTSVPGLGSKATTDPLSNCRLEAIIDICIVISREEFKDEKLQAFREALSWGKRQGGYRFIGDGGVTGRWSFKVRGILPLRNLYVVAEDSTPLRAYLSLRNVLRRHEELRREYESMKRLLAARYPEDILRYCNAKRPTIRKIFLEDGWTDDEVDQAEAEANRDWPPLTPADFYEAHNDVLEEGQGLDSGK